MFSIVCVAMSLEGLVVGDVAKRQGQDGAREFVGIAVGCDHFGEGVASPGNRLQRRALGPQ